MKFKKILVYLLMTTIILNTKIMTVSAVETKNTNAEQKQSYTKSELKLLACLVQAEASNQSYKGKLAVANVVLNRVNSKKFNHVNTIKQVIYDKKWSVQFTVSVNGMLADELKAYSDYSSKAEKSSIKAAKEALEGENNIGGYLNFTRYSSSLAKRHPNHMKIGDHIFF